MMKKLSSNELAIAEDVVFSIPSLSSVSPNSLPVTTSLSELVVGGVPIVGILGVPVAIKHPMEIQ